MRPGLPVRTAAAALLACVALPAGPAKAESVAQIVASYGLQPVSPPTPAKSFTLPDLSGGTGSLADYSGRWVVLTFWATWCGPCRSEMPSLEALHRERGSSGLAVLGVSIDQDRAPIEPYLRQQGLTFPMLWDARGEVAALYQASSIPLSYLIDPAGFIVGASRGARNWAAMVPMIDAVLASGPEAGRDQASLAATTTDPVALPEVLAPPRANVTLLDPAPRPGKPFELEVVLEWAGTDEQYLPHVPDVALPEGVERLGVTASTSSRDGQSRVTYRLSLRAAKAGSYALDPIELRYVPRFEAMPLSTRIVGPTVEVTAAPWFSGSGPIGVAAAIISLGAIAAGYFVWRRRRRATDPPIADPDSTAGRLVALQARFDAVRTQRLRGSSADYVTGLVGLALELGLENEAGNAELPRVLERARYGGHVPPGPELDRLQRRIERRLAELAPDPEQRQRETLRLRDA